MRSFVFQLRYNFDVRKGPVKIEWFVGAETNLTYNALDRHVEAGHGDHVAFYWEGNDLNEQSVTTYKELLDQASSASRHMRSAWTVGTVCNLWREGTPIVWWCRSVSWQIT